MFGGVPVTFENPILSFAGTNGSKPLPSPYAVYSASSSAQVIGQLSPPFARRMMVDGGAHLISWMTVLLGYGGTEGLIDYPCPPDPARVACAIDSKNGFSTS